MIEPLADAPAIAIEHMSFAYNAEPVLRDITMTVEAGQTLAIIGPNGAGKTTLVKILLGELTGYRGRVEVLGRPPHELPRYGGVGYVPQHRTALAHFPLTAEHAVMLGLARRRGLWRPFRRADRDAAREALDAVELAPAARKPMEQLSGGQVQRVCIARALVAQPRMLILDEPTVGIDEAGQQRFIALLGQLRQRFGLTVVMVSHDIRTVASLSDMVACLNVTLHCHDHPECLDQQTLFELFQCDFSAMHDHLHLHGYDHPAPGPGSCTGHDHPHGPGPGPASPPAGGAC